MDIWAACAEAVVPARLAGELLRVVESQEQVATTGLVDGLTEQSLLEEMLESTKPAVRLGSKGLHYLLATPFRYPPLPHGSRFGVRHEASLFYGAQPLTTALAETAYYRFLFWFGMATSPPSGRFITQHTVFGAAYRTERGLRLQKPPFNAYESELTAPGDYAATQRLGQAMRGARMEAFEYISARDKARGLNVALFEPAALASPEPLHPQPLLAETRAERVNFSTPVTGELYTFPVTDFLVEGEFPQPAP